MTKKKTEKLISKAAEQLALHNGNSACWWYLYQPPLPKRLKEKLKK